MKDFYRPEQQRHTYFKNISFLLPKTHVCESLNVNWHETLLVLVTSQPPHHTRRRLIRETWGSLKTYRSVGVHLLFVVGQMYPHTFYIYRSILDNEVFKHHDIIQIGLIENYKNLTEKTISMLIWATRYCPKVKYIIKTDDDCFNDISGFIDFLLDSNLPPLFIAGMFVYIKPKRTSSKWMVNKTMFAYSHYPYYAMGAAYVMTIETAKKILQVSQFVRYFPFEDIYITGLCRLAADIPAVNIQGILVPAKQAASCHATKVLNVHDVSETTIRDLWDFTQNKTKICKDNYGEQFHNFFHM